MAKSEPVVLLDYGDAPVPTSPQRRAQEQQRAKEARLEAEARASRATAPAPAPFGPLDSVRAGLGDPAARERFAADKERRAAATPKPKPKPKRDEKLVAAIDADERGAAEPGPPSTADIAVLRSQGIDARADDLWAALNATVDVPSSPNPMRPIREGYVDAMAGQRTGEVDQYGNPIRAGGILEDQERATAEAGAAEATGLAHQASAYDEEYARQQAILAAEDARLARDSQRRDRLRMLEEDTFKRVQDAADTMARTPDVDAGRYWASRKTWQKAFWALNVMARGFLGLDPMSALNAAIDQDIEEQRANIGLRKEKVGVAGSVLQEARGLFADLRASIADESVAEDAMRIARLKEFETRLMAIKMRDGVSQSIAATTQAVLQLRERRKALELSMAEKLASTPAMVGGGKRLAITGPLRASYEKELDRMRDRGTALEMKGIDIASDDENARRKVKVEEGASERIRKQALSQQAGEFMAKQTEKAAGLLDQVQRFKEKYRTDVPGLVYGIGAVDVPFSDADEIAQVELSFIEDKFTQFITGASSPPEMQKRLLSALRNAKSEGELFGALDELEAMARADIENARRGVQHEDRARFERVAPGQLPDYRPRPSTGDPSHIGWDDD